jgi:uncharacterized protein YndB with AHSA1/START domain
MSDSRPQREIVVTVAAPVDEVWRAFRDPAETRRWFGWDFVDMYGLADLDAEIELIFGGAEASDEDRTLRFRDDEVLRLEARGRETVVRVTRPGPADGDWKRYYDDIAEGWLSFFHQLRFALERHPGEERRTLHLDGTIEESRTGPVEAPLTETVGEVWFSADHQLGVTDPSLGDGLVVVTEQPVWVEPPRIASATITTYGLGAAAYADVRERWTDAWTARFVDVQVLERA